MQFQTHVDAAAKRFSERSTLIQKCIYLKALFAAMQREQKDLLLLLKMTAAAATANRDDDDMEKKSPLLGWNHVLLWDHVTFAERTLLDLSSSSSSLWKTDDRVESSHKNMMEHDSNNASEALTTTTTTDHVTTVSQALEKCALYTSHTKLLDPLVWNLHQARAKLYCCQLVVNVGDSGVGGSSDMVVVDTNDTHDFANVALADLEYCLSNTQFMSSSSQEVSAASTAQLQFLRAKTLFAMSERSYHDHDDTTTSTTMSTTGSTATTRLDEAKEALAKAIVLDPSKHAEWSAQLGLISLHDPKRIADAPLEGL